jgi:hypothetical protein
MAKPSKDGFSEDQWYDGLGLSDARFSSGPMNRCFYFLAAEPRPTRPPTTTAPLPAGMTGIGNDKAARIYYKALTEYFVADTDYPAAREALLQAAEDLYPGSQPRRTPSRAPSPRSTSARPPASTHAPWCGCRRSTPDLSRVLQRPLPRVSQLRQSAGLSHGRPGDAACNVNDAPSTAVEWQSPRAEPAPDLRGAVQPDGTFVTPREDYSLSGGLCWVTAVSKTDPLQFAVGTLFVINTDADDDLEEDAIDLGASALSWGLPRSLRVSHSMTTNFGVDNTDPAFAVEAIRNAYPVASGAP